MCVQVIELLAVLYCTVCTVCLQAIELPAVLYCTVLYCTMCLQAIELLAVKGAAKLIEFGPLRTFDVKLPR